ncbi:MAG TPA: FAD-binding oxidoreductase [Chloroflexi bacterium]|nr:FAD-binding oxidoreductase [Chloroflexota bacterium]
MKTTPFWPDDYPRPHDLPVAAALPSHVDVAVIGGGYAGLNAAYTLAKHGTSVAVLEQHTIGWGASSRNGGITGCGLKQGMPTIFKRYGEARARVFWQTSLDALEIIKALVREEGVDCDWQQRGDLSVAYKPSHFEGMKARVAWHKKVLNHELVLLSRDDLRGEIGSSAYYGGVLDPHGAGLHPAKLVFGLARVAARYGAQLCEHAEVKRVQPTGQGYLVHTSQGVLAAREVVVTTNGYTGRFMPQVRRLIVPAGSYSIVTEPLPPDLQREISPKGRVFWDSKWFLNYFRLTPDGRLLWGGRNDLSTDLNLHKSARILHQQMLRAFPQLQGYAVTHTWTGQLGIPFDLMPKVGRLPHGIHYAVGFGGHGLHMALYTGREVARLLLGQISSTPFAEIPQTRYFFYHHNPWFMPLVAYYYRARDWLS